MAAYTRVTKLVNPKQRATASRRPARKLKAKPKAIWKKLTRRRDGTFKKLVVKAKHHHKLRSTKRNTAPARPHPNPALMLTFGAPLVNPKRRITTVKTKKKSAHKTSHRRRTNPVGATRVVVVAPRANRKHSYKRRNPAKSNPRRRHVASYRRHNPAIFGEHMTSIQIAEAIGGGLVGVTATTLIVGYMPASLVGIGGNWTKVLASGVSAFLAGFLAKKVSKGPFGDGVLFGGLMQTMSVALNAFLPSLGAQFGLGDMGQIVSGDIRVPWNPVQQPVQIAAPAVPTAARITMSGLARAYGVAY